MKIQPGNSYVNNQMDTAGPTPGAGNERQLPSGGTGSRGGTGANTGSNALKQNSAGDAVGRLPLSQRGVRQSTGVMQTKFVTGTNVAATRDTPTAGGQGHGNLTTAPAGRRQGHRNQLVAQSMNVRNQFIGNQQNYFNGASDKAAFAAGPKVENRVSVSPQLGQGTLTTRGEKNRVGVVGHTPQGYLSNNALV